jgi:hypothetical protein
MQGFCFDLSRVCQILCHLGDFEERRTSEKDVQLKKLSCAGHKLNTCIPLEITEYTHIEECLETNGVLSAFF